MQAVIMAGGKGTRMGKDIPKQFIEINGKKIAGVSKINLIQIVKEEIRNVV